MAHEKNINYGIEALRPILCFCVVLLHCGPGPFIPGSVPIFFLISFFFFERTFLENDINRIRRRLTRLCVPQVGWAVIYLVLINIGYFLSISPVGVSAGDFVCQIIFGSSYNQSMWFQTDMIIITVIFCSVSFLLKRKELVYSTLFLLFVFSLAAQYSGLNYRTFHNGNFQIMYSLGRLVEMIPYAFIGLAYSVLVRKRKIVSLLAFAIFALLWLLIETVPIPKPHGFDYQGLRLVCTSICLFSLSLMIPFSKLPDRAKNIISFLSSYTLGIYCIHRLIDYFFRPGMALLGWEKYQYSFWYCVAIYLTGFVIFRIADRFVKNKYIRMLYR